jgi:hypothetical protein
MMLLAQKSIKRGMYLGVVLVTFFLTILGVHDVQSAREDVLTEVANYLLPTADAMVPEPPVDTRAGDNGGDNGGGDGGFNF